MRVGGCNWFEFIHLPRPDLHVGYTPTVLGDDRTGERIARRAARSQVINCDIYSFRHCHAAAFPKQLENGRAFQKRTYCTSVQCHEHGVADELSVGAELRDRIAVDQLDRKSQVAGVRDGGHELAEVAGAPQLGDVGSLLAHGGFRLRLRPSDRVLSMNVAAIDATGSSSSPS